MSTRLRGFALVAAAALMAAQAVRTAPTAGAPSSPWVAPPSEKSVKNPVPATAESLARGSQLYAKHCLACHGETGEGNGAVARRLGFRAGDLTETRSMGGQTDGEIFWKIATGRDPMPSFRKDKGLTDAQIWDLVNHVRTLARPAPVAPAGR